MKLLVASLLVLTFLPGLPAYATDEPLQFDNPVQRQRYTDLIEELRCLVCQNQNLADSNADLAQDLRLEVYNMIIEGRDNNQVMEFLTDRYGDFVLYRPPFKSTTWLLWLSPVIFLAIGSAVVFSIIRRQKAAAFDEENLRYADKLLGGKDNGEQQ